MNRASWLGDFTADLAAGRRPGSAALRRYGDLGRRASDAGVPLPELVDGYLSAAWRHWSPEADGRVVLRIVDDVVSAVTSGYAEAGAAWSRQAEARRRELVDDLLAGSVTEHTTGQAEALGFRFARPHVLLAAAAGRELTDADPVARVLRDGLHRRTREPVLAAAKDGVLVVLLPVGSAAPMSPVALTRPAVDVSELAALAYELVRDAEPGRWRVVSGRPRPTATAVAASWQEVRQTLELAAKLALPDPVVPAVRVDAHRLIAADPVAASRLAADVFGALESVRGGAFPLVETVLAVLDHGGNTAAARALHVSVRTVLYRLERVAELTGLSLDDPADRFTLYVAAMTVRLGFTRNKPRSRRPVSAAAGVAEGQP
ncbi:PucR family transcriptional regulator [Fodinicola acaciae]|uniref:PucR family transcriptional regulator n=1 Tax=Fodinicola acaciae TaxID=2681555 RepID=UPI0013D8BE3F|nr:helix-turn-helix domain-containing protein [Fodinicola acaciae]